MSFLESPKFFYSTVVFLCSGLRATVQDETGFSEKSVVTFFKAAPGRRPDGSVG